jgi:hypothetical protein
MPPGQAEGSSDAAKVSTEKVFCTNPRVCSAQISEQVCAHARYCFGSLGASIVQGGRDRNPSHAPPRNCMTILAAGNRAPATATRSNHHVVLFSAFWLGGTVRL